MKFSFPFFFKKKDKRRFILVISGGGMRGFYGLGIIKALEEKGYKNQIDAIYGVSAGALLASYWASGYSADEILDFFLHSEFMSLTKNLNLIPKDSLLKTTVLKKQLEHQLPKSFEDLEIPIFVGCSDTGVGECIQISKGDIVSALLATIAIPGIFPAVQREGKTLVDGGAINNFPTDVAREKFPHHKIIGISLNKYRSNPSIKNLLDNLIVSFEMVLRKDIEKKGALADVFICRALNTPVLEFNKKKLKALFDLGYKDGMEQLATIKEE